MKQAFRYADRSLDEEKRTTSVRVTLCIQFSYVEHEFYKTSIVSASISPMPNQYKLSDLSLLLLSSLMNRSILAAITNSTAERVNQQYRPNFNIICEVVTDGNQGFLLLRS